MVILRVVVRVQLLEDRVDLADDAILRRDRSISGCSPPAARVCPPLVSGLTWYLEEAAVRTLEPGDRTLD